MQIKFKRLSDSATVPTYATEGAAAFDFYATSAGEAHPGQVNVVKLGLAVAVPEGHALLLLARSSLGLNYGCTVTQGAGLIDSDYRGELKLLLTVQSPMTWAKGDRIAQGMIVPAPQFQIADVLELDETERGEGGFGSTGK